MKNRDLQRLMFFLAIAAAGFLAPPGAMGANLTNFIKGFAFSNANLVVTAGDTVKWINVDSASHSVTGNANNSPPEAFCGNPTFGLNGSCSHTFTNAGTFGYFCRVHPSMLGTLVVNPKANTPPTVTITNPPTGAVFFAPATVTIEATASDSDGSVSQVQFFVNGNSVGVATAMPYAAATNNVPAGNYTLSAVATDNSGASSTNSISITVQAPLIPPLLTSPVRGPSGKFRFDITGQAGQTYLIEASPSLAAWSLLLTTNAPSDTFRFMDEVTNLSQRFYRVRTP